METRRGIPVSAGVAIGPALVLDTECFRIPKRFVDPNNTDAEVNRFHDAVKAAAAKARGRQKAIDRQLGRHYGSIFRAHALLIEDPTLVEEIEKLIREHGFAAEYALSHVTRKYVKAFQSLTSESFISSRV